jgi:ketosteroid isomerase-like protein
MKLAALVLFLFSSLALAADVAGEIKKLDEQWADATVRKDFTTLNRIMADDLKYGHGNGSIQTKQQFLADLKSDSMNYREFKFEGVEASVFGNTAFIRSSPRMSIKIDGKEQSFQARFLRVYTRRNGAWQMVAHQATRVP